jgi:DNA-binding response OmpR family regulator/diadenosine tetraphosphate (Ap4A) HIT family hydrolase
LRPEEKPKVLLAEGDRQLAESLVGALQQDGFELYLAHDGAGALATYDVVRPDAVLIDVDLPGIAGLEVCAELRRRSRVGIVLLGRDDLDPVTGLEVGADDVIADPQRVHELGARLRAVLRRALAPTPPAARSRQGVLEVGDVCLDQTSLEVMVGDRRLDVAVPYFRMLELLVKNAGHVVTRTALACVTGSEPSQPRTVSNQIGRLRVLLGPTAAGRDRITVVRGRGYIFELPDDAPRPAADRTVGHPLAADGDAARGGARLGRLPQWETRLEEASDLAGPDGGDQGECALCGAAAAAERGADPWAVARLTTGYVRLNPVQFYPGATLFVVKDCVAELPDLADSVRAAHLDEMARVADVLHKTFPTDRLSCEAPSHVGHHLHWWLTPRRVDDPLPSGAIWQNPEFLRRYWGAADAEAAGHDETRRALCDALELDGLAIERCFVR